ncbi:hypothetical protein LMG7141_02578 [Ralstonia condita]|uniref:DUF2795 domain-containing protein n=1 Tax=Ralstonia condita TaxID=3058600 RepID=A0ABN9IVV4_9RALS|nr:DUF2795 domain-containing protein [Ralstonia sp. LMG 7141]CAJ0791903.1 hypothetical protein LMG7141_02578 [Ralstonia sp. LMG 7141]
MKTTRGKTQHASHSKSTAQSHRGSASADERGGHASHGNAGKSPDRAGAKSHGHGADGGGREHAMHSPISIQKALKGASYPAKKQELVKTAQANGADDSTLQTLRDMPDDEYDTPAAVSKAVGHEM